MISYRIGFGYDVHRIVAERPLFLGGIHIPYSFGLLGHSDADVLIHALCDALLGAANMRDIGYHFPDTDSKYKNIDSKILLDSTYQLIQQKGYELVNADVTVCSQQPKLNPYIPQMQETLSNILHTAIDNISIKATTTEGLGFVGKKEGISAYAVVLISRD